MDDADRANEEESNFVEEARRKAAKALRTQGRLPDGECRTCGQEVDPGRYALGFAYCLSCQEKWEAKSRMFRS